MVTQRQKRTIRKKWDAQAKRGPQRPAKENGGAKDNRFHKREAAR